AAELGAAAVMLLHRERFGAADVDGPEIPAPRRSAPKAKKRDDHPAAAGGKVTLFISLGKEAGIRPADLVGAIANEAHVESRNIGPIDIQHRFAVVGVPADRA